MYTSQTEKTIRANARTQPCYCCGKSFNKGEAAIRINISFFDEEISKYSFTQCPKCRYKLNTHNERKEKRREAAMRGECKLEDKKLYSWSDGSLYGGECQQQCHACNVFCTWGDVGSF